MRIADLINKAIKRSELENIAISNRVEEGVGPTGLGMEHIANARLPTEDAAKPIDSERLIDLTGPILDTRVIRFHSRDATDMPLPPDRKPHNIR